MCLCTCPTFNQYFLEAFLEQQSSVLGRNSYTSFIGVDFAQNTNCEVGVWGGDNWRDIVWWSYGFDGSMANRYERGDLWSELLAGFVPVLGWLVERSYTASWRGLLGLFCKGLTGLIEAY